MDYDARWTAIVNSNESESEKVKKLTSIALTMAIKGHAIEAFDKSMKAYGPGEARCGLIKGIFSGAKDVSDLESCFPDWSLMTKGIMPATDLRTISHRKARRRKSISADFNTWAIDWAA